ncbi:MAG: PEP-CTERM sorting domain-containing protein [Bryobacteraceae bacterium]
MEKLTRFILFGAFVFAGIAENAHGTVIVVSDATRGWFTPATNSGATVGNNYRAGFCPGPPGGCMSGPAEFRDFFTFAIPQLDGPVTSAVLTLNSAGVGPLDNPSMTYQITSIPSVFGFTDLGTGTVFGSRVYTAADQGTNQSITLNAAGIASIVSNATFDIGGRITTLVANPTTEMIFDSSGTGVCPACIVELQITTRSTVPEPATCGLFAAGFAALWVIRRRVVAR